MEGIDKKLIVLSAYSCDPYKGSEPGYGFQWAKNISELGFQVICVTQSKGKENINSCKYLDNLTFVYVDVRKFHFLLKISTPTVYLHYLIWQWFAYKKVKKLTKKHKVDLIHHVTWGSLQLGSFMYKLDIPLIFGPVGGGQFSFEDFQKYYGNYWKVEVRRKQMSKFLMNFNPAIKNTLKSARVILAANNDTQNLAIKFGAKNVFLMHDVGISEDFIKPNSDNPRNFEKKQLNILWVGRLLARKGVLLIPEIFQRLDAQMHIKLTVAGSGPMETELLAQLSMKGLANVEVLGHVPYTHIAKLYSQNDLFLFTSLRDSGGVQLLEAMGNGLPIICLAIHGQNEIVTDLTGIRCELSSPQKTIDNFVDAILELDNNRDKLAQMSLAAIKYAKTQLWSEKAKSVVQNFYFKASGK
jgi:glycosyltransferase involved in cell wall biosynthesis